MLFDKGKINISIQKTIYAPGDIISGNVSLTVKKPVNARELSVSLIGERKSTSVSFGQTTSSNTQIIRVYDFKQQLDAEKEYTQGGEYPFEIKIPADILGSKPQMPDLEGPAAQGIKIVEEFAQMAGAFRPVQWYLLAKLDIPKGLDINKKVDISIG